MAKPHKPLLVRAAAIRDKADTYSHPWNPDSMLTGTRMSELVGLQRTGVSWVTIPAGKESFVYHSHHCEEEWIYILSGRGVAEIDGVEHEVAAGDFLGFPTPSVAHHLKNPFDEELVYLMGGESREAEVADYPRLNKRMVRCGDRATVYDLDGGEPFPYPGIEKL